MLDTSQESHAREIAQQEVRRFARILADAIADTPIRADGNLNGREAWSALNDSIKRFDAGDIA